MNLVDTVRRKRNQISYEHAGTTSDAEAEEFYKMVTSLRGDVVRWLRKEHQALVPPAVKG